MRTLIFHSLISGFFLFAKLFLGHSALILWFNFCFLVDFGAYSLGQNLPPRVEVSVVCEMFFVLFPLSVKPLETSAKILMLPFVPLY